MATPVSDDVRKALAAKDPYALAAAANKEQLDTLRSAEELIEVDRKRLQELATARGITYSTGQAFHALNEDVAYLRLAFGWIDKHDIPEGVRLLAQCMREAQVSTSVLI